MKRLHQEQCSECQLDPPQDDKHHVPWDEVELKKHHLLTAKCKRLAVNLPKDEFELKKMGLLDSECNHLSPVGVKKKQPAAASAAEEMRMGVSNEKSKDEPKRLKVISIFIFRRTISNFCSFVDNNREAIL